MNTLSRINASIYAPQEAFEVGPNTLGRYLTKANQLYAPLAASHVATMMTYGLDSNEDPFVDAMYNAADAADGATLIAAFVDVRDIRNMSSLQEALRRLVRDGNCVVLIAFDLEDREHLRRAFLPIEEQFPGNGVIDVIDWRALDDIRRPLEEVRRWRTQFEN